MPFGGTLELVNFLANNVFGQGAVRGEGPKYVEVGEIRVTIEPGTAVLSWQQDVKRDIMADQFSFLLHQIPT